MSVVIPLQAVANQQFTVVLDGDNYNMTFKALDQVMAVTISRGGVVLLTNQRVLAETPLMPYRYLETGNFVFIAEGPEIPFYTAFGVTQTLLYFTADELRAIRDGT